MISAAVLTAFASVVLLDVVLAGDNAIVVGAIAGRLPPRERRNVIVIGTALALVLRIVFALAVSWLLGIPGVMLVGGALLLWVAWRMWTDLRGGSEEGLSGSVRQSFWASVAAVAIADTSMSLDNVMAVAAAARDHPWAMTFGLVLSVAMMGLGAAAVAAIIGRYRWIAYVGLALIVAIACRMVWEGGEAVLDAVGAFHG